MSASSTKEQDEAISFGCPHMVGEARMAAYDELRENTPVYKDPITGNYVLTRFKDVRSTLVNHRKFSNDAGMVGQKISPVSDQVNAIYRAKGPLPGRNLQTYDPPEHKVHRGPIDRAFDHWKLEQLRDFITEQANRFIDTFIDKDEVEIVGEFAIMYPLVVFADQLGVAHDDADKLKFWADVAVEEINPVLPPERELEIAHELAGMSEYFQRSIREARANPDDRLLTHLINVIDPDDTEEGLAELLSVIRAIVVAAGDTTTFGIAGGIRLLVENPGLLDEIRNDHDKLLAFVEETLRIVSPVQTLFRKAREDTEIGGVAIPAGSIIEARYGAGDLDPEAFPCPYKVDLSRENIRNHVGFGVGTHACPGMVLARTEMEIGFKAIADRMTNLRAARGADSYEYTTSYIANGPVKAWLAFDRR